MDHNARVLQRMHALGLNNEESLQLLALARHECFNDMLYTLWEFREKQAPKYKSSYAAMNALMKEVDFLKTGHPESVDYMKVCYIAHPIGGNVTANLAQLRRVVQKINHQFPDVVPFVPYYADVVSLDDGDPGDRKRGIENDHRILGSGIVDELWLCGGRISTGMQAEKELAEKYGILVVDHLNDFLK